MSWIIYYLLIGIGWDIIFTFLARILESKNILNNHERVISLVIWPIFLSMFMYHFIKGLKR